MPEVPAPTWHLVLAAAGIELDGAGVRRHLAVAGIADDVVAAAGVDDVVAGPGADIVVDHRERVGVGAVAAGDPVRAAMGEDRLAGARGHDDDVVAVLAPCSVMTSMPVIERPVPLNVAKLNVTGLLPR